MRTLIAHQLAQQHPHHDPHPLAREDGGWYPGKHFDPTDILTDPKNWTVWKQFLLFFFGILLVPVLSFIGVEWILRAIFHLKFQQSQTIGAIVAIVVLQVFMISYARRAVLEERTDYAEQQQQQQRIQKTAQEAGQVTSPEVDIVSSKEVVETDQSNAVEDTAREEEEADVNDGDAPNEQASREKASGTEEESTTKEDEATECRQAQEEEMPEKQPDSELGVGGQVKKRK